MKIKIDKTPILLIIFSLLIIVSSLFFPKGQNGVPGPGFFPGLVGIFLLILSILLLKEVLLNKKEQEAIFQKKYLKTYISIFTTLIYIMFMEKIGFIVMTTIYMFIIIRLFGYKKIKMNLLVCIISTLAIFYLFNSLLNVPLSLGIFS